jgi:hypothetical protein
MKPGCKEEKTDAKALNNTEDDAPPVISGKLPP